MMPTVDSIAPDSAGISLTLACNFQTRGAIGLYSWSPGQGNQWTVIHKDTQWQSSSGPHPIPPLPAGSKLMWIAGLVTTAHPPASVSARVVLSQGGNALDVVQVAGTATATTPVSQNKMYNL